MTIGMSCMHGTRRTGRNAVLAHNKPNMLITLHSRRLAYAGTEVSHGMIMQGVRL